MTYSIGTIVHGKNSHTFSASFELHNGYAAFKDVGIVEYCSSLPTGSKWPRMRKEKRARIELASVREGYAGACEVQAAEDSKFLEIVRSKLKGQNNG